MSIWRPEGVRARHSRSCDSHAGGDCDCRPSWQASVWSNRERRRTVKTFSSQSAAKAWRRRYRLRSIVGPRTPSRVTLREAAEGFIDGIGDGSVRIRKGERSKPSAIRGYERTLRLRVLPVLGAMRLSEIERSHVQALADDLVAEGLAPATCSTTSILSAPSSGARSSAST